jgi:hypothetical protein
MSNLTQFTNKQNIALLWDVLLDELDINTNNKTLVNNVRTVFESNIKPFTSRCNPKMSIMELNKQFLSQVVLAVNRLFPNLQKQEQNIKRITITNEEAGEPYKIEDIHASRQTNFEKEVERKRIELENYMTPQKPKELDFSYGSLDGKITAMDSLVADKMSQRNLEFEQFQSDIHNTSRIEPENWLRPKETSVNADKHNILNIEQNQPTNNRLKHINIDNNNNITLNPDTKKKVSFADSSNDNSIINIFQKLKRQPIEEIIDEAIEQKQYIEQKSQPLPEIQQEQINRATIVQQTNINPIIPKNAMITQLNEMNTKIDNLYELFFKLTNSIQELIEDKSFNNSKSAINDDDVI